MKLARYLGNGVVEIQEAPRPTCPPGGLLVKTEACGLCSGELMHWYMDRKVYNVLGHEVAGKVCESDDLRFPIGARIFVHHHAPCLDCDFCRRGAYVHCPTWKSTRLDPGGMAEYFAVAPQNLNDAFLIEGLTAHQAALIEPVACTVKCLSRAEAAPGQRGAVIGLGTLGLVHLFQHPEAFGIDVNPSRVDHARSLGLNVGRPSEAPLASFDWVVVCPGTPPALELALSLVAPQGTVALFAPLPPGQPFSLDLERLYFSDLRLVTSYSCGPPDTRRAAELLRDGTVKVENCVSDFVTLEELPGAYQRMSKGEILKAMVEF